jgi:hypothetical protein
LAPVPWINAVSAAAIVRRTIKSSTSRRLSGDGKIICRLRGTWAAKDLGDCVMVVNAGSPAPGWLASSANQLAVGSVPTAGIN